MQIPKKEIENTNIRDIPIYQLHELTKFVCFGMRFKGIAHFYVIIVQEYLKCIVVGSKEGMGLEIITEV